MPTINNTVKRAGAHILHELSPQLSRENITLTGGNYVAGTVLAKVTATGKYKQLAPAAADGTQTAVMILFDGVDASGGDKPGIGHDFGVVVKDSDLTWPAGITAPQKASAIASLRAQGVKVK